MKKEQQQRINIPGLVLETYTSILYTNKSLFQFATSINGNFLCWWAAFGAAFLHFSDNIGSGNHMTENDMFAIQPISSETEFMQKKH